MSNPAINRFRDRAFANAQQPAYVPVQPQQGYGYQQQYQQGYPQQGYGQPGYGYQQQQAWPSQPPIMVENMRPAVMTMDSVMAKTGIMFAVVIGIAAITWAVLPLYSAATYLGVAGAAIAAFVLAIIVSTRRVVHPGGALAYAAVEGFLLGAISKATEAMYSGIISQAVLATFVAAAMTVGAVRIFKIRTGHKFRLILTTAMAAFAAAMFINFIVGLFGANLGLVDRPGTMTGLGVGMVALGTILAVLSLVDDVSSIQQGIEAGVPDTEAWRAAFGLTVTLVWLYINILRILRYINSD